MGILVVTADPNDGSVRSTGVKDENNDHIFVAREGNDLKPDPFQSPESGTRLAIGGYQTGLHIGAQAIRAEAFAEFKPEGGFALPLSQLDVVSAAFRGTRFGYEYPTNETAPDSAQVWNRPWSSPVSSQWYGMTALLNNIYTGIDLEVYDLMRIRRGSGNVYSPSTPEPELYEAGGDLFRDNVIAALVAGVPFQVLLTLGNSLGDMQQQTKSQIAFWTSSNYQTDPKNKPSIIVRSIKKMPLQSVGASSIQMTDGTAVFLRREIVGGVPVINLYYQRINTTVPVLIRKLPTTAVEHANYYATDPAFQSFGLTRDSNNNLFIVGTRGAVQQSGQHFHRVFNVNAFRYNGGYSWTYFTPTPMGENGQVPSNSFTTHRGLPNNFAPVWLPNSQYGSAGQLVVFHSRRDGQWAGYQLGSATMYAGWLMGDVPASGRNHKTSYVEPYSRPWADWRPFNSAGNGLDATPGPQTDRVYAASFVQADAGSDVGRASVDSFALSTTHDVSGLSMPANRAITAPHDPEGKVRSIWMGDSSPYYAWATGGRLQLFNIAGDTGFRSVDFTTQGITGFPSKEFLQGSSAWDVIWDNSRNVFWIYYIESTNHRNIRKFSYDHINNVISTSSAVAGPLGASGSSIVALRLPRQRTDIRCFLIDVAMQDATLAPVYPMTTLRDISNNLPPIAPTLPTIDAFNAASSKNIDYAFNDPNEGDYSTSHEVQIRRVSTGATVVSSGKVASGLVSGKTYRYTIAANALSNDTQYQIRIRNYDAVDAVGVWSEWKSFTTTATGGTVLITQPAQDLEPLDRSSVLVKWTYSNTTAGRVQNGYQVRVYNDVTNALISDSGIVASTATERTVSGLPSDVRARIEVAVRDTTNALSGAGIRLVFPDYDNPAVPSLVVTPMPGYIEVRVTNPPPSGENPLTVSNQIARKESSEPDSSYVVIGTCPLNGIFEDYTVASGIEYSYKVRGST